MRTERVWLWLVSAVLVCTGCVIQESSDDQDGGAGQGGSAGSTPAAGSGGAQGGSGGSAGSDAAVGGNAGTGGTSVAGAAGEAGGGGAAVGGSAGEGGSAGSVPGTPGKIGCGSNVCNAAIEHCCTLVTGANSTSSCLPTAQECVDSSTQVDSWEDVQCDESADCQQGMCCDEYPTSNQRLVHCVDSAEPASKNVCAAFEVCVSGGVCLTEGTACKQGTCVDATPSSTCGAETCEGATPICCAIPGGDYDSCTADTDSCASQQDHFPLGCASTDDCPSGQQCCLSLGSSFCRGTCDGAMTAPLCGSESDCPPQTGLAASCEEDPSRLPAGLKVCTYL